MQFPTLLTLTALLSLSSAAAFAPEHEQISLTNAFSSLSTCEKTDLADCTAYCANFEEKASCGASGDKVTCRCQPVKKSTGCLNCLLCLDP